MPDNEQPNVMHAERKSIDMGFDQGKCKKNWKFGVLRFRANTERIARYEHNQNPRSLDQCQPRRKRKKQIESSLEACQSRNVSIGSQGRLDYNSHEVVGCKLSAT
jgi:hypothetical protein